MTGSGSVNTIAFEGLGQYATFLVTRPSVTQNSPFGESVSYKAVSDSLKN